MGISGGLEEFGRSDDEIFGVGQLFFLLVQPLYKSSGVLWHSEVNIFVFEKLNKTSRNSFGEGLVIISHMTFCLNTNINTRDPKFGTTAPHWLVAIGGTHSLLLTF